MMARLLEAVSLSCLLDARLGTLSNRSNSLVSEALGVPASLSHPMLFGVLSWGGGGFFTQLPLLFQPQALIST